LEWRDSESLQFDDEKFKVELNDANQGSIEFQFENEYTDFKLVHTNMAPKENPFLMFPDLKMSIKTRPSVLRKKTRPHSEQV